MATKTISTRLCKGHNSPLLKCLGEKKITEFYNTWNQFTDGKTFFCKECIDKIWKYYMSETNDAKISLWYCCQKLDIPFVKEIYDRLYNRQEIGDKNGRKTTINIKTYISELYRSTLKKDLWTDFSSSDINILSVNTQIKSKEEQKEKLDTLEKRWGRQDISEDYDFLEETFKRYTYGVEFVNPQQEDLYQDLCRDRLILRKINDNRYNGDESIDKVQARIGKTMSTLKVDQFESNKPKTASEQLIFSKIAQIEQTKPADLYKEPTKYKDFNKIEKYEKDMVLRPLLNTLCGHRDFNINIDDINKYNLDDNKGGGS